MTILVKGNRGHRTQLHFAGASGLREMDLQDRQDSMEREQRDEQDTLCN